MKLITLTTDLGIRDFYIPAMKGILYSSIKEVRVVDITHQIRSFNIVEAATILKNSYHYYPKGTIHLVDVNSNYNSQPVYCAAQADGYLFVGADNGIIPHVIEKTPDRIVEIGTTTVSHFPLKDVLVPAAIELANGKKISELGPDIGDFNRLAFLSPAITPDTIKGTVMYVDSFMNAITNIHVDTFDQARKGRSFKISLRRTESINYICDAYGDVPEGEIVAIFGMSGYLEIAINKGRAATLLGLEKDQPIIIDFE